ncbi:MAG TPA: TonB family protein [Kofleriaceae bacterium]|nr:TonB family protein [Kofleriaceae bacterium]
MNRPAAWAVHMGMFDHVLAERRPVPRWLAPVLAAAILFHVLVLAAAIIHSYWNVDRLPVPHGRLELLVPVPTPPPPAGRAASAPRSNLPANQVRVVSGSIQPVHIDQTRPQPSGGGGAGGGSSDGFGQGGGIGDGPGTCIGITCSETTSEPPDIKVVEPPTVRNEPIAVVDKHFLSGTRQIHPDESTQSKMGRDGTTSTRAVVKMCLGPDGHVDSLDLLQSSGYPDYDAKILATMRAWRYSEFGGQAIICSPVTFVYNVR